MPIRTYHCLCCAQLLLATPYPLASLPRRASPALDGARILPLAPPSPGLASTSAHVLAAPSMLLSLLTDRRPVVVRRPDGFERRRVRRCARCGVGVAYVLEPGVGVGVGVGVGGEVEEGDDGKGTGAGAGTGTGEGEVLYLLEGALVETESLERDLADVTVGDREKGTDSFGP